MKPEALQPEVPMPDQIRIAREAANLTQAQAAVLVHDHNPWAAQEWDAYESGERPMDIARWELFLLETGQLSEFRVATPRPLSPVCVAILRDADGGAGYKNHVWLFMCEREDNGALRMPRYVERYRDEKRLHYAENWIDGGKLAPRVRVGDYLTATLDFAEVLAGQVNEGRMQYRAALDVLQAGARMARVLHQQRLRSRRAARAEMRFDHSEARDGSDATKD